MRHNISQLRQGAPARRSAAKTRVTRHVPESTIVDDVSPGGLAVEALVEVDTACAAAVDLARASAIEVAGAEFVGDHLGVEAEGERIVTHYFASTDRAYLGWRWAVTVVRPPRSKAVTVDEVVLLPGAEALLAPAWVPWSERLQAGDLGVGDVLPTAAEDERLSPGYSDVFPHEESDDDQAAVDDIVQDLWLGRPRVLSLLGREESAQRWYDGDHGPHAAIARAAELTCSTCGFLVLMRGALSRVFGICANEFAPDDGRVVAFDHGCGAHSEALVIHTAPQSGEPAADAEPIVEPAADATADVTAPVVEPAAEPAAESVGESDAELAVEPAADSN